MANERTVYEGPQPPAQYQPTPTDMAMSPFVAMLGSLLEQGKAASEQRMKMEQYDRQAASAREVANIEAESRRQAGEMELQGKFGAANLANIEQLWATDPLTAYSMWKRLPPEQQRLITLPEDPAKYEKMLRWKQGDFTGVDEKTMRKELQTTTMSPNTRMEIETKYREWKKSKKPAGTSGGFQMPSIMPQIQSQQTTPVNIGMSAPRMAMPFLPGIPQVSPNPIPGVQQGTQMAPNVAAILSFLGQAANRPLIQPNQQQR